MKNIKKIEIKIDGNYWSIETTREDGSWSLTSCRPNLGSLLLEIASYQIKELGNVSRLHESDDDFFSGKVESFMANLSLEVRYFLDNFYKKPNKQ